MFGWRVVAAVTGVGHAHFDDHVAGRREAADLPAVDRHIVGQALGAQRGLPERGRGNVAHEAAGHHLVAVDRGLAGRFVDFLLTDAGAVHIGLVRQVHQVVDHQPVVGLDVVKPAAVGPLGVVVPLHVRDQRRVGLVLVTWPDPDEPVALHHRKAADRGEAADALAGHGDRLAVATHFQPVVATDQLALADVAQRQRGAAVRAEIFHRRDLALLGPVEHDGLVADGAAQGLFVDFFGRAGHIPGEGGEHACLLGEGFHSVC